MKLDILYSELPLKYTGYIRTVAKSENYAQSALTITVMPRHL